MGGQLCRTACAYPTTKSEEHASSGHSEAERDEMNHGTCWGRSALRLQVHNSCENGGATADARIVGAQPVASHLRKFRSIPSAQFKMPENSTERNRDGTHGLDADSLLSANLWFHRTFS
jgi:hypothetical protein